MGIRSKMCIFAPSIMQRNMDTQILNLKEPYDYIYCNGEIGMHVATYIVGEQRIEDGKYVLETHSHPIVKYLNLPAGVVWDRAELTDCEVLCNEKDMRVEVRTFLLLCCQMAQMKEEQAEARGEYTSFSPADEAKTLKFKLRQHGIGFKSKNAVEAQGVEIGSCSDGYFAQLMDWNVMDFHFIEPTLEELGKRLTEERENWEAFYDHVVKIRFIPDSSLAKGFVETL